MDISYADIALNSFIAHLSIPVGSETLVYAMREFDVEPLLPSIAVAWVVAVLAYMVNYALGRIIERVRIDTGKQHYYGKAQKFFQRWLVWLLLLSGQPFMSVVAVGAGIFEVSWQRVILLTAIGHGVRYALLFMG